MHLFLLEGSAHLSRQFVEKLTDNAIIKLTRVLREDLPGDLTVCMPDSPDSVSTLQSRYFRFTASTRQGAPIPPRPASYSVHSRS
jgi:hypothetical protein